MLIRAAQVPIVRRATLCIGLLLAGLCPDGWADAERTPMQIAQVPIRQYRAFGTHLCQSASNIGHQCSVTTISTDCNAAYFQLKNDDCCPPTSKGGQSIKFTLESCGVFAQPKKPAG